jgi:ADP-ribose pyrophosphatase YjhB (NUDIX family)
MPDPATAFGTRLLRRFTRSLPAKRMAAGSLLHVEDGRLLIVDPTYKRGWTIPGGVVKRNESPRAACRREVWEELGIDREPGRLLCVDYMPEEQVKTEALMFLFDGGLLTDDELASIRLPMLELRGFDLVTPAEAADRLDPPLALRLQSALRQLAGEGVVYLESGRP